MKILIITSSFPNYKNSYFGCFLIPLIRELEERNCEVKVLTQSVDKKYSEEQSGGAQVCHFKWHGGHVAISNVFSRNKIKGLLLLAEYVISAFVTGNRIIKKWEPDIIHAEWLFPGGYIAKCLSAYNKVPYTARALGSDVYILGGIRWFRFFLKRVSAKASALFADGFDLCDRTSILAGNKACYFAPTASKVFSAVKNIENKGDNEVFTCITIGRLHSVKGQDILIRALGALKREGRRIKAVLVGDGDDKVKLQNMIINENVSDAVTLAGQVDDRDMEALCRQADCMIIPSRSESIPMVLSEAAYYHLPLIVSDAGDMPMLVKKYNLGLVFKKEDHDDLAGNIRLMMDHNGRLDFSKQRNELLHLLSVQNCADVMLQQFGGIIECRQQQKN